MTRLTRAIVPFLMAMAGAVQAQSDENPVIVELFTSQGCSSCPAADQVLAELRGREDVIPLALHVDYWDYIGWKDGFADPAFTKRQKGYARAAKRRSVYTPQMMIDGRFDVVGSRPMKVVDAIRIASEAPDRVKLTLKREGGDLVIHAVPLERLPETLVQLVRYAPEKKVDILDGENAGRSITYTNIAHGWQVLGEWDGRSTLDMRVSIAGDDPVVVMIQEAGYGPVVAAARAR